MVGEPVISIMVEWLDSGGESKECRGFWWLKVPVNGKEEMIERGKRGLGHENMVLT